MLCTHVGLYSYLPLSLVGPKGEVDKGGEGSPVGLGGVSPNVTSNPLTRPETLCTIFIPDRPEHVIPTNLKEDPTPGEHHRTPEDSTFKPIPQERSRNAPRLKRRAAISSYHRPRLSLPPPPRRWKDALAFTLPPRSLHSPSVIPEKSGIQGAQGDCIKGDRSIHSADRMTPMENRLERRAALLEFGATARGCPEDIRSCPFPANLDTIS